MFPGRRYRGNLRGNGRRGSFRAPAGPGDHFRHFDKARHVQPVMPGQIESKIGAIDPGFRQLATDIGKPAIPRSMPVLVRSTPTSSHMTSMQLAAERVDIAGGLPSGAVARAISASSTSSSMSCSAAFSFGAHHITRNPP